MGEAKRAVVGEPPPMAWHYTDLVRAVFITDSGALEASRLNPRGAGKMTTGRRVLWFTTGRRGEASASGRQAERDYGIPLVRLGLPLAATLPAREGCLAAGWSSARVEEDELLARRMGADPATWRVVVADSLPLADLTRPEVRQGERWQALDPARLTVRRYTVSDGSVPDFWLLRGYGLDLFVTPETGPTGERGYLLRSAEGKELDA